ncbi:tRNA-modifying protein YgfZ [Candidatus Curculioniphilus buchneri]|uniref:tRNA-modifying protein YgfZ n=1 Tax=Candidatus Curculioniphilus buchneri TaxID=690594 RepID=UPI00376F25B2
MLSNVSFTPRLPLSSQHLPLTLISLEEWALITLHGKDTIQYLQGQFTCDVKKLKSDYFCYSAHCDPKGKMISNLFIFYYGNGMGYIVRRSVRDIQLSALKKYSILSQITITANDQAVLLGIAGFQAQETLSELFDCMQYASGPVIHHQHTTIIHFNLPTSRFLLITTPEIRDALQKKLTGIAQFNDSQQWLALDIEAGYPLIDSANITKFIPQATNIQAFKGIDFNKGCYIGQETVARAQYRGINKRSLYWLLGQASHIPVAGDELELQIENRWRRTGTVLAACRLADTSITIQAVMNNHLSKNASLRVCNDSTSMLNICPLPCFIKS